MQKVTNINSTIDREQAQSSPCRPKLKTRAFSTHHIVIFEYILLKKTNREIGRMLGYSCYSHVVVDHSRKVMYKLLALENLTKKEYLIFVKYPREYCFWWKKLLEKHKTALFQIAIRPIFYE